MLQGIERFGDRLLNRFVPHMSAAADQCGPIQYRCESCSYGGRRCSYRVCTSGTQYGGCSPCGSAC
ncbi:hypothetical protein GCM10010156_09950 [Planobispora rosea]|uniref:Uncharacterized protein n=1 Tax=Planobispora rosea TaxID=35762 RepID=A0A8J3RYI7_PLARO|nr:hypothetical protein [Planobispora rosea]GGS53313.1 hypothetical protein GCM10010156_09950 [Planobispora rosea]GIH82596.1 hypothetical protein Pro02_10040 [Planobispora rosea]